jgi:hypothetical protein
MATADGDNNGNGSGRWMLSLLIIKSIIKCKKIKQPYRHINQLGNYLNVDPDSLALGLWIDGAGTCANDQAPRALLWVHLEEIEGPTQMLWAALLGVQVVPDEEISEDLHDPHACLEELAEVPRLCQRSPNGAGPPVLDVPSNHHKARVEVVLVLTGVVVGHLAGSRNHCGSRGVEGGEVGGGGGNQGYVLCCLLWGAPPMLASYQMGTYVQTHYHKFALSRVSQQVGNAYLFTVDSK